MVNFRGIADLTLKGLASTQAPGVMKGLLNELLRHQQVSVEALVEMVEENRSLWDSLPEAHRHSAQRAAPTIGKLDWLTVEWLIETIRHDHPALASLFLSGGPQGWRKGKKWLAKQIEEIRSNLDADL